MLAVKSSSAELWIRTGTYTGTYTGIGIRILSSWNRNSIHIWKQIFIQIRELNGYKIVWVSKSEIGSFVSLCHFSETQFSTFTVIYSTAYYLQAQKKLYCFLYKKIFGLIFIFILYFYLHIASSDLFQKAVKSVIISIPVISQLEEAYPPLQRFIL